MAELEKAAVSYRGAIDAQIRALTAQDIDAFRAQAAQSRSVTLTFNKAALDFLAFIDQATNRMVEDARSTTGAPA